MTDNSAVTIDPVAGALSSAPATQSEDPEETSTKIRTFVCQHVRNHVDQQLLIANIDLFRNTDSELSESSNPAFAQSSWRLPVPRPTANETFAAVMIADVSHYSSLCSRLAEQGNEGVELLARTVKNYLDQIVDRIAKHRGDIVKFAGDALIACWRLELDPEEYTQAGEMVCRRPEQNSCECLKCLKGEVVLEASLCCLALLKHLGSIEVDLPGHGTQQLTIHIGVGAGQLFDIHLVGDEDRYEFMIAGDAVNQLELVLHSAEQRQLALSPLAFQSVKHVFNADLFSVTSLEKKGVILAMLDDNKLELVCQKYCAVAESNVDRDVLFSKIPHNLKVSLYQKYLNPSVVYKLQHDFLTMNELRQVTSIFIRIGRSFTSHRDLEDFQITMELVQSTVKRMEGHLIQFNVDDKGTAILICFGLPPLAHQNDAYFGTFASLNLVSSLSKKVSNVAIGVTTGCISISCIGNAYRMEHAIMGDSINMAARLMCLPQCVGNVLCDERTYSSCQNEFEYETISNITVKGKTHPIQVYKLLRPKQSRHGSFTFQVEDSSNNCDVHLLNSVGTALTRKPDDSLGQGQTVQLGSERTRISANKVVLIGRQNEKSIIKGLLEKYIAGKPTCLLVEGSAGCGTSTVMAFLREQAADLNISVCYSKATELNRVVPYSAFQDVIFDLIENSKSLPSSPNSKSPSISNPSLKATDTLGIDNASGMLGNALGLVPFSSKMGSRYMNVSGEITKSTAMIEQSRKNVGGTLEDVPVIVVSNQEAAANNNPVVKVHDPNVTNSLVIVCEDVDRSLNTINTHEYSEMKMLKASLITLDQSEHISTVGQDIFNKPQQFLSAKIRATLRMIGMDPNFVKYFGAIFPIELGSNSETLSVKECNRLASCMKHLFNHVAKRTKIILVFEEIQLLDRFSWRLIEYLFRNCPNVMFCFCTKSQKEVNANALAMIKVIQEASITTTFSVGPMLKDDMEELILHYWTTLTDTDRGSVNSIDTPNARKVAKDLINEIYQRSSGSPLFSQSLMRSLIENDVVEVTNEHELKLKDSAGGKANVYALFDGLSVVMDIQSLFISQLDRLKVDFQQLLKVASAIGEQFTLQDVVCLLPEKLRPQLNPTSIDEMDIFEFLHCESSIPTNTLYSFKSVLIRSTIYGTMYEAQKKELHKQIAQYYAAKLNEGNRGRYMIPTYDHYVLAGDVESSLKYLEDVCEYYYESRQMEEAILHYKKLVDCKNQVDKSRLCNFYFKLGEAYRFIFDYSSASFWFCSALSLLDFTIFEKEIDVKRQLLKEKWIYMRSSCSADRREEKTLLIRILYLLSDVLRHGDNYEMYLLSLYSGINLCKHTMHKELQRLALLANLAVLKMNIKDSIKCRNTRSSDAFDLLKFIESAVLKDLQTKENGKQSLKVELSTLTIDDKVFNLGDDLFRAFFFEVAIRQGQALILSGSFSAAHNKFLTIKCYAEIFFDYNSMQDTLFNVAWIEFMVHSQSSMKEAIDYGQMMISRALERNDEFRKLLGHTLSLSRLLFWEDFNKDQRKLISKRLTSLNSLRQYKSTRGFQYQLIVDSVYALGVFSFEIMFSDTTRRSFSAAEAIKIVSRHIETIPKLRKHQWISIYAFLHFAHLLGEIYVAQADANTFTSCFEGDKDLGQLTEDELYDHVNEILVMFCRVAIQCLKSTFKVYAIAEPISFAFQALKDMFVKSTQGKDTALAWSNKKQKKARLLIDDIPTLSNLRAILLSDEDADAQIPLI